MTSTYKIKGIYRYIVWNYFCSNNVLLGKDQDMTVVNRSAVHMYHWVVANGFAFSSGKYSIRSDFQVSDLSHVHWHFTLVLLQSVVLKLTNVFIFTDKTAFQYGCVSSASVTATRCQYQWGEGPQMNKFEQVSSDHHQMSVAGAGAGPQVWCLREAGPQVWCPGRGGGVRYSGLIWGEGDTLPCDLSLDACNVPTPPSSLWRDRHLWKQYLPATLFAGGKNPFRNELVHTLYRVDTCRIQKKVLTTPPFHFLKFQVFSEHFFS